MLATHRDLLLEGSPRSRAAAIQSLLASGWAPARILSEAPYLPAELVAGGDASRDLRPIAPARPRASGAN